MSASHSTNEPSRNAVRVLAAGAVKAVVLELAPSFEARTGLRLDFTFDTVGALADRVLSGDKADVTVLSMPVLEMLASKGFGEGTILKLGSTGVALAGRGGIVSASIETPDQFRAVLLEARSIGYADPARGATAGRHFTGVLDRLDLADALRSKLRMFPFGVDAVDALGRGEIELAVSQATEILTQPSVTFLGLFPEPYHLSTAYGATALSSREEGWDFLKSLSEPEAADSLRRAGFR